MRPKDNLQIMWTLHLTATNFKSLSSLLTTSWQQHVWRRCGSGRSVPAAPLWSSWPPHGATLPPLSPLKAKQKYGITQYLLFNYLFLSISCWTGYSWLWSLQLIPHKCYKLCTYNHPPLPPSWWAAPLWVAQRSGLAPWWHPQWLFCRQWPRRHLPVPGNNKQKCESVKVKWHSVTLALRLTRFMLEVGSECVLNVSDSNPTHELRLCQSRAAPLWSEDQTCLRLIEAVTSTASHLLQFAVFVGLLLLDYVRKVLWTVQSHLFP